MQRGQREDLTFEGDKQSSHIFTTDAESTPVNTGDDLEARLAARDAVLALLDQVDDACELVARGAT